MTKLSFQLPKFNAELPMTEESKINASYAMLGVVAISSIVAMVFLFQHMLVVPGATELGGFVIYPKVIDADKVCDYPQEVFVPDSKIVNAWEENQGYKCSHVNKKGWCCASPNMQA